jgi:hypothetical protein
VFNSRGIPRLSAYEELSCAMSASMLILAQRKKRPRRQSLVLELRFSMFSLYGAQQFQLKVS